MPEAVRRSTEAELRPDDYQGRTDREIPVVVLDPA